MNLHLPAEAIPLDPDDDKMYNICCVISDSLRWDIFKDSNPQNILQIGNGVPCHSIAGCTLPTMTAYMMNYPPIGIGRGLFHQGYWVPWEEKGVDTKVADSPPGKAHFPLRIWMPRYYKELGYKTIFLTGNSVPFRLDQTTGGMFTRYFDINPIEYLKLDVATPTIIRDLSDMVKEFKDQPIFAVILLLDTHSPYHDGEGNVNMIEYGGKGSGRRNYENQLKAMKYVNKVFPNFVQIFSETNRPTKFIFTSDHGENFEGEGWGHNCFRPKHKWTNELYQIPFVRGCIKDWEKVSFNPLPNP
jgi:hypothetical protein